MSFDLQVFTRRKPRVGHISGLLAQAELREAAPGAHGWPGLLVDDAGVHAELDGPLRIRPADLPAAAAGALQREGWTLTLSVRGATDAPWPPDLVRTIAAACDGVVWDPQQDAVTWPEGWRPRPAPEREQRIDVLEISWFCADATPDTSVTIGFLERLQAHFPAALPRRYGDLEPFQHTFNGPAAPQNFATFWRGHAGRTGGMFFWSAQRPCLGGFVATTAPGSVSDPEVRPCTRISLSFDARPFQLGAAAATVFQTGFADMAAALGSFYAAAVLNRGFILRRGNMAGGGEAGPLPFGPGWVGLPAAPVWLAWFGPPYAPLVQAAVAAHARTHPTGSLLLQAGPLPMHADQLSDQFPPMPLELIARSRAGAPRWRPGVVFTYGAPPPSRPAARIPPL